MDKRRLYRVIRGFLVVFYGVAVLVGTVMFFSELPAILGKPFETRLVSVVTILVACNLAKIILELLLDFWGRNR